MTLEHALLNLAHRASSLRELADPALTLLRDALGAQVAVLASTHTTPVVHGLDPECAARLVARWDRYAPDAAPVHARAMRDGAATDRRVHGARLTSTRTHREIVAPAGGCESLFVVGSLAGQKLGFVMLGRLGRSFTDVELARAARLAPVLSLICGALDRDGDTLATLSDAERDLYRYLELGYASAQIATARGTSFFTVRNQLSGLYRKLGVANRTEAVGLTRRAG